MKSSRGFVSMAVVQMIGYGLAAVAVVSVIGYGIHRYNEWVREPQYTEIAKLKQEAIDATEAARVESIARQKREDEKSEKWRLHVIAEQDDYEKRLAAAIAAGKPGRVFSDPGARPSCGGTAEKAKGNPEVPAGEAASSQLSGVATAFLQSEALRADKAAIYADKARDVALECIAELNAK